MSTKIECDNCKADLTITGNSETTRLRLSEERIPTNPGPVTDMYFPPMLSKGEKHFCSLYCLRLWLNP